MPISAIMIGLTCSKRVDIGGVIFHSSTLVNIGESTCECNVNNIQLSEYNVRDCLVKIYTKSKFHESI